MSGYYASKLAAERLVRCYDIAPPRVRQYLQAEIDFATSRIFGTVTVLELGCGYGRIMRQLAPRADLVVGIDTSLESLQFGKEFLNSIPNSLLLCMDATKLAFRDEAFDFVLCLQNGISAFKVDPRRLMQEAIRVTKRGGRALFSSYADAFWEDRLHWFRLQAGAGLLGPIDEEKTGNGVIVCKDGFSARTFGPDDFRSLVAACNMECTIFEVDNSSLFCEISC